jgi:hypothetical protein
MLIGAGDYPLEIFGGLLLVVLIVYAEQVPMGIRSFMDSLAGRLIGIVSVLAATKMCGWVYGVLVTLAYLLILHTVTKGIAETTYPEQVETFVDTQITKPAIKHGKRWYVEQVLGENPKVIDTVEVFTPKVSDNSDRSMGHPF